MSGRSVRGRTHVVGAGLAGLAAAVTLGAAGREVRVYEASGHAGGRCRSYFDSELGCRIDNGNHLLLGGNRRALEYLDRIGARGTLEGPGDAVFPFVDVANGRRWTLRPNRGRIPWWVFHRARRVPETNARDYLAALALRRAGPAATVAETLDPERLLFTRLWAPLAVAALNTAVEEASAQLLWRIFAETLGRGGAACRPLVPRDGLSETFVDPALETLRGHGAGLHLGARLRALEFAADRVKALLFDNDSVELGEADGLVLAVPAAIAARLLPGLVVPDHHAPIVNAHFRFAAPSGSPLFVGVVGGVAEWVFRKRQVLSVTVSAADRLIDRPAEELGEMLWRDVATVYDIALGAPPAVRVVKERRATFVASPDQLRRRPAAATRWCNLVLAGDYTDTGLPATIEGAVGSGFAAARLLVKTERRARLPARTGGKRLSPAASPQTRHEQQPDLS